MGASWESHHFVLEDSVMRCLSEEIEPISASGEATREPQGGAPTPYRFKIGGEEEAGDENGWSLCAETEEDMAQWVRAIAAHRGTGGFNLLGLLPLRGVDASAELQGREITVRVPERAYVPDGYQRPGVRQGKWQQAAETYLLQAANEREASEWFAIIQWHVTRRPERKALGRSQSTVC